MRAVVKALVGGAAAVMVIAAASAQEPATKSGVDAPELAALGGYPVGVTDLELAQPDQADPVRGADRPVVADRQLPLKIWYPAAGGAGTTYHTALSGETGVDVPFTVAGIATPGAAQVKGRFPIVILAHGYGNAPELLSWLGENLASKGYVVVAPAFRDPPIGDRTAPAFAGPLSRRPLDIAFAAAEVQRRARAHQAPFADAGPGLPRGRIARFSHGAPTASVCRGFQPGKAAGMMFEHKPAS